MIDDRVSITPRLDELTALAPQELSVYNKALGQLLIALPLQAYVDVHNVYWFAITGESTPEHDRWLYAIKPSGTSFTGSPLYACAHQGVGHCGKELFDLDQDGRGGPILDPKLAFEYLAEDLQNLADEIDDALAEQPTLAAAFKRQESLRKCLLMFRAFGYLGIDFSNELLPLKWDQELHDLLHHYEAWVERNPEAEGLPQDLVLRMHGLHDYAAHLSTGLNWLDGINPQLNEGYARA